MAYSSSSQPQYLPLLPLHDRPTPHLPSPAADEVTKPTFLYVIVHSYSVRSRHPCSSFKHHPSSSPPIITLNAAFQDKAVALEKLEEIYRNERERVHEQKDVAWEDDGSVFEIRWFGDAASEEGKGEVSTWFLKTVLAE